MALPMKKTGAQKMFSLALIALGVFLGAYMVVFEDEPGAVPLLLVLAGTLWLLALRRRGKG